MQENIPNDDAASGTISGDGQAPYLTGTIVLPVLYVCRRGEHVSTDVIEFARDQAF